MKAIWTPTEQHGLMPKQPENRVLKYINIQELLTLSLTGKASGGFLWIQIVLVKGKKFNQNMSQIQRKIDQNELEDQ